MKQPVTRMQVFITTVLTVAALAIYMLYCDSREQQRVLEEIRWARVQKTLYEKHLEIFCDGDNCWQALWSHTELCGQFL